VSIGMLGLDTAFGRDGVARTARRWRRSGRARASSRRSMRRATPPTSRPYAERLFASLRERTRPPHHRLHLAGVHPLAKFVDMRPERFNIQLAPGGNILPQMNAWRQFAGTEGGIYYYHAFGQNPMNTWLNTEYRRAQQQRAARFLRRRRLRRASAVFNGITRAGGTDTERLIAAMEGMELSTRPRAR